MLLRAAYLLLRADYVVSVYPCAIVGWRETLREDWEGVRTTQELGGVARRARTPHRPGWLAQLQRILAI